MHLFGKVPVDPPAGKPGDSRAASFASACAIVRNCHRSVIVVPKPEVFDDSGAQLGVWMLHAES